MIDPTENIEAADPMLPIEATEPTLPIDNTEPCDAMLSSESVEERDRVSCATS
ncbi:MAG: hypothetical protein ACXV3V_14035 [Actinomycetes bacterium]